MIQSRNGLTIYPQATRSEDGERIIRLHVTSESFKFYTDLTIATAEDLISEFTHEMADAMRLPDKVFEEEDL